MTNAILPTAQTAKPSQRLALRIFVWIMVLVVFSACWFLLLASLVPSRNHFASFGAILVASTPPALLTFVCWTGVRRFTTPRASRVMPSAQPPAPVAVAPPPPAARFRIGAWSVLTPYGNVIETVAGTKARIKVFKPDQAICHPSGYPAHAAIIADLKLEALGYSANTRTREARVITMLVAILDDLYAQQVTLTEAVTGPANVYWIVPDSMVKPDNALSDLFAKSWQHSTWHETQYILHLIAAAEANAYAVLSALQSGIDQSSIPYTLLIAADSLLDREELAPALALGHVFSPAAPQGFIPSEGAGGLLLLNPNQTPDDLWSGASLLGPVETAPQAVGGLLDVMSRALTDSEHAAHAIGFLVSDSDHRSRGSLEVINGMAQALAGLDPLDQRLSPMEYAGAFGAATDLIHLALAVELAGDKATMALGTSCGFFAVTVVAPA